MTAQRFVGFLFVASILWVTVCPALAAARTGSQQVDVRHYRFGLELSDADDVVRGVAEIHLDVLGEHQHRGPLQFDLVGVRDDDGQADGSEQSLGMTVDRVALLQKDGRAVPFNRWSHEEDLLSLTLAPAQWESLAAVRIEYSGVPRDGLVISNDRHGQRTFFGDNWPNRARHWLPAIDHPSDKALVTFEVTAPAGYQVISVGERVSERDLGDGRRVTTWSSRHPLPTKVMVMGAAQFHVEYQGTVRGVPIESWIFAGDYPDSNDAFDETAAVVEFFVDRWGSFPYSKLANVQSKTRFGGMENASAIFYSENAVARGASEGLVAHEIAHQWFGDSVTEADWPHVWLSEGFATYLTQLYFEWRYGSERLEEGMGRARRRVVDLANREPAPVIPERVDDLMNLLSANSYQKGAWVLHMLRRTVGNDVFYEGLRRYYEKYRDSNATTAQFREVIEQTWDSMRNDATSSDLEWFFDQWLRRPGHPVVTVGFDLVRTGEAGGVRVMGEQMPFAPGSPLFRFPLEVELVASDGATERTTLVFVDSHTDTFVETELEPVSMVLDPDTWLLFDTLLGDVESSLKP